MRRPRVVIIGAGPSGASAALALRQLGAADVLVLDKSVYPRVKVCGSGLSPLALAVLDQLRLRDRFRARHAVIAGLWARGPDGGEVRFSAGEGAWVVPRVELDQSLIQAAVELGARFQEDTKVLELLRDPQGNVRGVRTAREELEADLVLCADGSPARFSRDTSPRYGIRTLMGWWKGTQLPTDATMMVWDRKLDGYYAWSFPEPDGITNIGLTIPEGSPHASRLKDLFQELLDEHFLPHMKGAEQLGKWMGHPAVLSTRVGAISESRAMSIGEAARLVMPATVEGIGFALESGGAVARFVHRHFDPARGLTPLQQRRYRFETAARVVPKFLAGEAFVRAMRSPRARRVGSVVTHPRVIDTMGKVLVSVLGEQPA